MKASPQLLIVEAAIGLFEDQLDLGPDQRRADLLVLGQQLHRLNRLYIGLAEAALEAAGRDRVSD
jgi:hypothetical protein